MLRYQINIFWSDEDDAYIAAVPDLPGCSAFGDSYEDALREVQVAMSLWIDTAKEFGDLIPSPGQERAATPANDSQSLGVGIKLRQDATTLL